MSKIRLTFSLHVGNLFAQHFLQNFIQKLLNGYLSAVNRNGDPSG